MDHNLPLGAHLVTPRGWYSHHGVYVGEGRVVHYAGFSRAFHRGPIEETSLEGFAKHFGLRVKPHAAPAFSQEEIVRRAKARMGEDRYGLLSNNCEHFSEWCIRGRARSSQIEALFDIPVRLAQSISKLLIRLSESMNLDINPGRWASA
ncbi:MAG: lecithin retinol acyltransferase family protein [Burkholderiales bacterium]